MRAIFKILILGSMLALLIPAYAIAPDYQAPIVNTVPNGPEWLKGRLQAIGQAKGLPEAKIAEIEAVIEGKRGTACPNGESQWDPKAIGDGGTSYGLVQIHLPAHPGVTAEQALDAEFALNFIVDEFLKGNERKWTCWRAIFLIQ